MTNILERGGGIPRDSLYIMNVVKCRPPKNRDPSRDEILKCREHMDAQLALIHPDIIVTMGNIAFHSITHVSTGITSMRGKWINHRGIKIFPMFHPSYLLRNEGDTSETGPKYLTWIDVRELKAALDRLK